MMAAAVFDSVPSREGNPSNFEDLELVAGILAGEERCFDVLYERHRGRIFGFALNRLGDPAEAEDVTQEVFLQVHRSLATFQRRSTLLTWMFGIAHNQVCRRFRRKVPTMVSLEDSEAASLAANTCPTDRVVEATRLLRHTSKLVETELSPSQREIFYLRFCGDVGNSGSSGNGGRGGTGRKGEGGAGGGGSAHSAIAKQLGKSSQAVKISLFRSRRTLTAHTPDVDTILWP